MRPRVIPAEDSSAGSSSCASMTRFNEAAGYPRVCGGARPRVAADWGTSGPSPRARGVRGPDWRAFAMCDLSHGSSPRAGPPARFAVASIVVSVFPRGRGAGSRDSVFRVLRNGSSPRARGRLTEWQRIYPTACRAVRRDCCLFDSVASCRTTGAACSTARSRYGSGRG